MLIHMRTTIVIDDDLSIEIDRLAAERNRTKREIIDELLRRGISAEPQRNRAPVETQPRDLGTCKLPNIDDVSETLAVAEGEAFR